MEKSKETHFSLFDSTSIELFIECPHSILYQHIFAATQGLNNPEKKGIP